MSTKILDVYNYVTNNHGEVVKLVTHKGRFHADDIMATAILRLFFEKANVTVETIRTFTPEEDGYTDYTANCIVYDIGGGQYDHHQTENNEHTFRFDKVYDENGEHTVVRKYSSVGLIWNEIGEVWLGKKYAKKVYDQVLKYIDDTDNGFGFNPLSSLIGCMNTYNVNASEATQDIRFEMAVVTAQRLISSMIKQFEYMLTCESKLYALAKKGEACLVSDEYIPGADDICREYGIPFYVYPNQRGGYCFKTINKCESDNTVHLCDIPEEVKNWNGVTFLHHSRFLGSAVTKERAINICASLWRQHNNK